jgi:hypothetical protein
MGAKFDRFMRGVHRAAYRARDGVASATNVLGHSVRGIRREQLIGGGAALGAVGAAAAGGLPHTFWSRLWKGALAGAVIGLGLYAINDPPWR